MDPFSLADQRILIAGAAGGIGSATAALCARMGAGLVLADMAPPPAPADAAGDRTLRLACDTSSRAAVEALAREIGPVDAVIDAAGLCPFDDWTGAHWDLSFDRVMQVNVRGPLNLARAFLPGMMARGFGRLVLVGSLAGRTGGLKAGPHYTASKGAVHALVRWLAQRATPSGVCVNAVAPATTLTRMAIDGEYSPEPFPQKRFLTPEEIAAPLAFLCTPGASGIAGVVLDVNAGLHFS